MQQWRRWIGLAVPILIVIVAWRLVAAPALPSHLRAETTPATPSMEETPPSLAPTLAPTALPLSPPLVLTPTTSTPNTPVLGVIPSPTPTVVNPALDAALAALPTPHRVIEGETATRAPYILSTTLVLSSSQRLHGLMWSPTSEEVVYQDGQTVYLLDVRAGHQTRLPIEADVYAWSPDGQQLAYLTRAPGDGVVRRYQVRAGRSLVWATLPDRGATVQQLVWTDTGMLAIITVDGIGILSSVDDDHLTMHARAFPEVRSETPDQQLRTQAFWAVPTKYAVSIDPDAHIVSFLEAGREVRRVPYQPYVQGVWSPNGAVVALTDRNASIDLYRADGTVLRRVLTGSNVTLLTWLSNDELVYRHNNGGSSPHDAYMLHQNAAEALRVNEALPDGSAVVEVVRSPHATMLAYVTVQTDKTQLIIRGVTRQR